MPKKRIPGYRHHKPSGRAVVTLDGKDFYLGQYNSKASWELYQQHIADYLANDCKLPPTRSQNELAIEAASIRFLDWAEGYYVKHGKPTKTFSNYRESLSHIVRWYGQSPVSEFGPLALQFVRNKLIEAGHVRKTINDRICCIVNFYRWLISNELCPVETYQALKAVPNLRQGRTTAPDNPPVPPVPVAVIEATLPYLPPIVRDMVQIQRLAGMRPQDIRNMRGCDVDRSGDVWVYRPFTHKTEHHGKILTKAIGPRAQAILAPYLLRKADTPEAFLFSPADMVRLHHAELREKRKTKVQPSQRSRKKAAPQSLPKEYYTNDAYNQAVERAIKAYNKAEKKLAEKDNREPVELPKWTPNQLRHNAGTDTAANFSLEAAKEFLGHSSIKTTEKYYVAPLPELAAKVAREIG